MQWQQHYGARMRSNMYYSVVNAKAHLLFQLDRVSEGRACLEVSVYTILDDPAWLSLAVRCPVAERYWAKAFKSDDTNGGEAVAYINA